MRNNYFLGLVVLVVIIAGGFFLYRNTGGGIAVNPTPGVCAMDVKQCSDGSYVGRTGPDCQFVCPVSNATSTPNTATVETKLNEKVSPLGEGITVLSVIEDSRCPTDVQCIQAGSVRVSAKVESGSGIATQTFTLNQPITTESEVITLVSVLPEKKSTITIKPTDYKFTFRFDKR